MTVMSPEPRLTVHMTVHRMPKRLSDLISGLFYGGRLQTAASLSLRPGMPAEPCRWVDMAGGSGEVAHKGKGISNPSEAAVVAQQATLALSAGNGLVYVITVRRG